MRRGRHRRTPAPSLGIPPAWEPEPFWDLPRFSRAHTVRPSLARAPAPRAHDPNSASGRWAATAAVRTGSSVVHFSWG